VLQLSAILQLDIYKAINHLRPPQSVTLDGTTVTIINGCCKNSYHCLNMFCILACRWNTFQRRTKTVFVLFGKCNISFVSNYRPNSFLNKFSKIFPCVTRSRHVILNINWIPINMIFQKPNLRWYPVLISFLLQSVLNVQFILCIVTLAVNVTLPRVLFITKLLLTYGYLYWFCIYFLISNIPYAFWTSFLYFWSFLRVPLTSSPFSILATTKASAFLFIVCMLPPI
jgi:hypothetical protein